MLEPDAARPELAGGPPPSRRAWPERPHHQKAPENKPDEEADLPEAAKLDVRKALIAEPEPALVDDAHDPEVVADQGARDDEQRHPEQQVGANAGPWPPGRRR